MTKKKQVQPSITWRVGDGPVHEIPDGAEVTFTLQGGTKRTLSLGMLEAAEEMTKMVKQGVECWKDAGNPSQG